MVERPILFSGPMVRAILAGTKTQTRRVLKPQRVHGWDPAPPTPGAIPKGRWSWRFGDTHQRVYQDCPFGVPGDRLWVREAWCPLNLDYMPAPRSMPLPSNGERVIVSYRADHHDPRGDGPAALEWRPSIHMPRWASRITLEITDVRVERLQDITEEDARAEGVEMRESSSPAYRWLGGPERRQGAGRGAVEYCHRTAREAFRTIWDSIYGSWEDNPWVWVVSFRRVEVPHG